MGIVMTDAAGKSLSIAGGGGVNHIPPGGLPSQVLVKGSTEEYNLTWGTYQTNPNLLDNWYFLNPINQRGVSGTITTPGYFIDRWKLISGSVTISENGLVVNGTIVQLFEDSIGQPVTASALTTGGIVSAEYNDANKMLSITGTGQTFIAAKLELGSQQTLAHKDASGNWVLNDPPPNKALELAKCQRYQVNYLELRTYGYVFSSNAIRIVIPLPAPLASTATVKDFSIKNIFGGDGKTQNCSDMVFSFSPYYVKNTNSFMITCNSNKSFSIAVNSSIIAYVVNLIIDSNL